MRPLEETEVTIADVVEIRSAAEQFVEGAERFLFDKLYPEF
jgi:hypothetical protein